MPESDDAWEESWAKSFEEGFYDNLDGSEEKTALLIERGAGGRRRVLGVATGAQAQELVANAERHGLSVLEDAHQVDDLLHQDIRTSEVPSDVYGLMATLVAFAQDLEGEWIAQAREEGGSVDLASTEIEYGHEDVS